MILDHQHNFLKCPLQDTTSSCMPSMLTQVQNILEKIEVSDFFLLNPSSRLISWHMPILMLMISISLHLITITGLRVVIDPDQTICITALPGDHLSHPDDDLMMMMMM